jgi:transposase-like protein
VHGVVFVGGTRVIQFPNICPACESTARHQVIPTSPEVETFRCENCGHEWSVPAPPRMRPVPEPALPRQWFAWRKKS